MVIDRRLQRLLEKFEESIGTARKTRAELFEYMGSVEKYRRAVEKHDELAVLVAKHVLKLSKGKTR